MNLFIDDIRNPVDSKNWIIARNSKDAIKIIKNDFPQKISFDHDLGGDDTAMNVVNFIIDATLDKKIAIPVNFEFFVHSANPVGAKNIKTKLNNFLLFLKHFG